MRGKIGFTALCMVVLLAWSTTIAQAESAIRIFAVYPTRTEDSVTISWRTDPETKGSVEYADQSGEWKRTPWSDAYTEQHVFTLFNLNPATTYIYRINAEMEDGTSDSKSGDFTTLDSGNIPVTQDSKVLGSSFQALLSPSPTPFNAQQNQQMYYQNQQFVPYQYIPVPYPVNMYPQPQVLSEQNVVPTAIPTITPEPTPKPQVTGFTNENAVNLIVGILLGVSAAFLLHQLTKRRPEAKKTNSISKNKENTVKVVEDEEPLQEYTFETRSTNK